MMFIFCFICQGLTCQHEDQCKTLKPCHGGRCRTGPYGGYSCRCLAGWTGQNCSVDIDECGVAARGGVPVCHHGATCVNTPGSFSCNCIPGYTGTRRLTISCHSCTTLFPREIHYILSTQKYVPL